MKENKSPATVEQMVEELDSTTSIGLFEVASDVSRVLNVAIEILCATRTRLDRCKSISSALSEIDRHTLVVMALYNSEVMDRIGRAKLRDFIDQVGEVIAAEREAVDTDYAKLLFRHIELNQL